MAYSEEIGQAIVAKAQTYIGQNEIQPNQGFVDPTFDALMRQHTPFENGDPWCACLAILTWSLVYMAYPKTYQWFRSLISANSQQMGRNFHADPTWKTNIDTPVVGAMVIFGDVGSTVSGHTACCIVSVDPDGDHYTTIEGNTIPPGNPGNQAEGYTVAQHIHSVSAGIHSQTGLKLIRFVYPEASID